MPNPQIIALTPPSLPPGYCFTTFQQLAIDLFAGAFGTIAASVGLGFNFGAAIPGVNDQSKPWLRLNASGAIIGTYSYAFGRWVREHPIPAGPNGWRGLWVGSVDDLYLFDGGDGSKPSTTPPTNVTGTFYEADPDWAGRVFIGAGTLPLSGTILSIGDIGGLDMVSLTVQEMPPHTHTPQAEEQTGKPANEIWGSSNDGSSGGSTATGKVYPGGDGLNAGTGSSYVPINTTLKDAGGVTGVTPIVVKPHENMPPFRVGTIIRRTSRAYYTA